MSKSNSTRFTFSLITLFLVTMIVFGCSFRTGKTNIFPYSMVQYQKGKFIDDSEITVEDWAEYVFQGHLQDRPDSLLTVGFKYHHLFYPTQTPDSLFSAYGKIDYYQLPVVKEYFDTLSYSELREILDFPISAISYDNAINYCKWRTTEYNKRKTDFTKKRIEFVLPDEIIVEPLEELFIQNKNNRPIPIANFKESKYVRPTDAPNKQIAKEIGKQPIRTKIMMDNQNEIFDLWGNVSEMTAQKGIAFGGSYQDDFPLTKAYFTYTDKAPWLGFRCVGLVTE